MFWKNRFFLGLVSYTGDRHGVWLCIQKSTIEWKDYVTWWVHRSKLDHLFCESVELWKSTSPIILNGFTLMQMGKDVDRSVADEGSKDVAQKCDKKKGDDKEPGDDKETGGDRWPKKGVRN